MITIAKCVKTGEKTNKKRCLKCSERLISPADKDKCVHLYTEEKQRGIDKTE